jgi:hypothetical protein
MVGRMPTLLPFSDPRPSNGSKIVEWRIGVERLARRPAPWQFNPGDWREIVDASGAFLREWGEQAEALGWTTLDLFGCHPTAPAGRHDGGGLALYIGQGRVTALDASSATIDRKSGARLTFWRSPTDGAIPVWDLP